MKLLKFFLVSVFALNISSARSQDTRKVDTVRWHNVIYTTGQKDGKNFYAANDHPIDSATYVAWRKEHRTYVKKCHPCYLIQLNHQDKKISEGLSNLNIPISDFISYHKNGKVHEKGKYNQSGNKDGVWKIYDISGKLKKTENYNNGVLK